MAVRLEKVVLSLEDHFTTEMARAAAATALLDKNLDSLSGSAVRSRAATQGAGRDVDQLGRSADRSGHSINQLTGRLRIMADAAAVLGPSLVPIGGVGFAAVSGLASQLGFAAIGMTSLIAASQGVGDALKALNVAALDPTTENLQKAREAMDQLGPAAQSFVRRFQELRPTLRDIRDAAATGWFPGLTDALDSVERVGPRVAAIFEEIGKAGGSLVAEGAAALSGPQWADFLAFVETNAPQALDDLGRSVGNVVKGLAELWMATDPINDDFSSWLLDASRGFEEWADGLAATEGFQSFVEYVRTNGPRVGEALKSVGVAVVEIIEALAPLGGPSLKIIETFADILAAIADSDIGTPILAGVAALAALNRVLQVTAALQTKVTGSQSIGNSLAAGGILGGAKTGLTGLRTAAPTVSQLGTVFAKLGQSSKYATDQTLAARSAVRGFASTAARGVGPIAGLTVASTGAADGLGLSNTASLALMGTIAGPWGAAIGGGVGLVKDLAAALDAGTSSTASFNAALASGDAQQFLDELAAVQKELDNLADFKDFGGDGTDDLFQDFARGVVGGGQEALSWLGIGDGVDSEGDLAKRQAELKSVLESQSDAAERAALSQAGLSDELVRTGHEAGLTASQLLDLADSTAQTSNEFWDAQDAQVRLAESMERLAEAADKGKRGLDKSTEGGRENWVALGDVAKGWQTTMQAMIDAQAPTEEIEAKYRQVRKALIDAARQMGATKEQIATLRTSLAKPMSLVIKAEVNDAVARAKSAMAQLRAEIAGNPIVQRVIVQTDRGPVEASVGTPGGTTELFGGSSGGGKKRKKADGGLVIGPGGPRDDRIPTWLSNREYVIPAHIVDEFGVGFFDALRAGEFSGAEGLASGGRPGKKGKRGKNRGIDFLVTPDLEPLFNQLDFGHLSKSVKALIRPLEKSKEKLEKETSARQALAESLQSSVADKLTSQLFGQTDVWTAGSTFEDVMAKLNGDTAGGLGFIDDVATLRAKGLDEEALAALLAEGDTATIDAWAELSAQQLQDYETAFNRRAEVLTDASTAASTAAFGAVTAPLEAQLAEVNRQLDVLTAIQKTAEKTGPSKTGDAAGKAVGKATKTGAGKASRSRNRSSLG